MQEELERDWKKTSTTETITEENDDDYNDDGETVYPDRNSRNNYDNVSQDDEGEYVASHRDYDDVDQTAAVKIQSNYRGYRTRKHTVGRRH